MTNCKKCGKEIEKGRVCNECKLATRRAASKKYYEANKEKVNAYRKAYFQKIKASDKYADLLEKHKVAAKRYWDRKKAKRLIESGKLEQMILAKEKEMLACKDQWVALKVYKEKWYKEFNISLDVVDLLNTNSI